MVDERPGELQRLLDHGEDHTLDYKSADLLIQPNGSSRRKIARHLVAFANREGGRLVFGVTDDTKSPEGVNIKKEPAISTISEIARDRCSPPVDFELDRFYTAEAGELEAGTVVVVKINPGGDIPSAVVDNSGGEIKRREYWLRTGDEKRLVDDQELKQMFLGQLDPDTEERIRTWYFYTEKDPAPGYHPEVGQRQRPLNASWSQNSIAQYLARLSDEDKELWLPEGARGLSNLTREIVPLAVVNQLSDVFRYTWDVEWEDHLLDGHNDEPDAPAEVVEIDRSKIESGAMYSLDRADIDWYSKYTEYGNSFMIPAGTDVKIENKGSRPVLIFHNGEMFNIEVGVVMEQYDRVPQDHPYSGVAAVQRDYDTPTKDWLSVEYEIGFKAEYGFPDVKDSYVESHELFGDQILNTLYHFWSADVVIEGLPDRELYEVNEKMDYLLEGMDELLSSERD